MCFFLEGAMLKYLNAYKNVNPMATISGKFCVPTEVRNKWSQIKVFNILKCKDGR